MGIRHARSQAVLWNGPAIDPGRQTIFVGAVDLCVTLKSVPGTKYVPRALNMGGGAAGPQRFGDAVPTGDRPSGWVTAVNADTGAVRWKYHADTPILSGVTPTAGGIVMTGDNASNFLVFDSDNGKLLLKRPTGGALAGGVVTYAREGRQYVAFTSGNVSPTAFAAVGRPSIVIMACPPHHRGLALPTRLILPVATNLRSELPGLSRARRLQDHRTSLKAVGSRMNAQQIAAFILNPRERPLAGDPVVDVPDGGHRPDDGAGECVLPLRAGEDSLRNRALSA